MKKKNKVLKQYIDEQGHYVLTGELLWKYRALDAEYKNLQLAIKAMELEIKEEIKHNKKLLDLITSKDAHVVSSNNKAKELSDFNKEIEMLFGLSLKDCAIDDQTGRLYFMDKEERKPLRRD